ncbi:hypothetical protein [Leptolyngbya sp. 7M]|uniref:hypothetical protein n=1 Tax=Leptolyngbya sp. 7M TaxID=2812896 RepID=UPI001B8C49C5|nr:hypothetical protein [Leptolyngbya sp. 7M]QYO62580.1 hypothetical protein JVX88_21280 [Leptolyngbya sp. 7M]
MRQSHAEIKAIEAELRSIRADQDSSRSVTLLQPDQSSETAALSAPIAPTIAPTIVRPTPQPSAGKPQKPTQKSTQRRSVECFPLPNQNGVVNPALSSQLLHTVEQLQQQSMGTVRRFKQVQAQYSQAASQSQKHAMRHLLAEKAKQINHLASQQEMVILELIQISEQLEQNESTNQAKRRAKNELIFECFETEVPYVEVNDDGTLILTSRAIDPVTSDERPDADAQFLAQSLRQRRHKSSAPIFTLAQRLVKSLVKSLWWLVTTPLRIISSVASLVTAPIGQIFLGHSASTARPRYRGSGRRATATETPFTLREAASLVVGSALLRVFLDWIVATYPVLWVPSLLVMVTPALLAAYRSTVMPQSGFAWGYRLFAIMIGLLLGGRL